MNEIHVLSVRNKLTAEKIKLWLAPYTAPNCEKGNFPEELVNRYSSELCLPKEEIHDIFEHLRKHSLDRLAANQRFQITGTATLRIKIVNPQQQDGKRQSTENIEMSLDETGLSLKSKLAQLQNVRPAKLKLISSGRVLQDDKPLKEQNIQHNAQLLALVLSETEAQSIEKEQKSIDLKRLREDSAILSSVDVDDPDQEVSVQIADQTGKPLNLPKEERRALTMAMVLHEKGRAAFKNKNYSEALFFLLEADKEFSNCNFEILKSVDNYALLCLDICWCYLQLQSVNHLSDAENRLKTCEEGFRRSYGDNMERLHAIKGGSEKEAVLYTRLYLLKAIVAFHNNELSRSKVYLDLVADNISRLKVNDQSLAEIMAMGYTTSESRLGLRAAANNVPMAIQHIINRREEKEEIKKKEKEKRQMRKRQKKLGKTASGEWLDISLYDSLIAMGFNKTLSRVALQHSNNNLPLAVQLIQEQPELLVAANNSQLSTTSTPSVNQTTTLAATTSVDSSNMFDESMDCSPETSSLDQDAELAMEAMGRIAKDIATDEEDYLDLTLEEEEVLLQEYLARLKTLKF